MFSILSILVTFCCSLVISNYKYTINKLISLPWPLASIVRLPTSSVASDKLVGCVHVTVKKKNARKCQGFNATLHRCKLLGPATSSAQATVVPLLQPSTTRSA